MLSSPHTERYSRPAMLFHWAIFLLIAVAYLAIEVRGPKGTDSRAFWSNVHFWCGSLILGLAVLRVLWRLWKGAPANMEPNPFFAFLARLVHLFLYLFIFVQPLLGILLINTAGYPVTLAGLNIDIVLVDADPVAQPVISAAHVLIGNVFYWVIGIHALAAIGHHVVFKDNTLRRMI
jgi:cytochrome b561